MKEIEVHGGDIRIFAGGKTVIDTTEDKIQNPNITRVPSVIVQSRGIIDFIYYDKPFTFKNEMWGYTSENETSIKFLYYYLKNNISYFRAASISMGALPQISLPITEKFKLPVPPMEVQREIVRILDSFTLLTAELTARKKQYEFYRDFLLSFDELDKNGGGGCELKMLGEILGYTQPANFIVNDTNYKEKFGIPVLTAGQSFLLGYTNETFGIYKALKNPTIIFDDFTTSFQWVDFDFKVKSSAIKILNNRDNQKTNFRFVYYAMRCIKFEPTNHERYWISKYSKIKIPVPSLQTQQKVFDILDKFDTLVNSITEGLPREIELRRKQYEHYRELLLNFKPKMTA